MASCLGISCIVVCPRCITKVPNTQYAFNISSPNDHRCAQTVLLVRESDSMPWYRIRDRTYQNSLTTTLSTITTNTPPQHCIDNDMICTYAHSLLEQRMWQMENDGKQNIFDIITSHREVGQNTFENIGSYLMSKFGGWLRCVCRVCFHESSECGNVCCGSEGHQWDDNKVLAHCSLWVSPESFTFNVVDSPSHSGNGRNLPVLCKLLQDCPDRANCAKSHSFIERDFAFVRQHCPTLTIEQFCEKLNQLKVLVAHRQILSSVSATQQSVTEQSHNFQFSVVCKECHQLGMHESRNGTSEACTRGHLWKLSRSPAVLERSTGKWIPIKALPQKLPKDAARLDICRHIAKMRPCPVDPCQFAHSQLEKDVWTWQMTSQPRGLTYLSLTFLFND